MVTALQTSRQESIRMVAAFCRRNKLPALQHNELEVTHCSHSIRPAVRQTTSGAPAIRTITRGGDVAGPLRPPRERARLPPSRKTPREGEAPAEPQNTSGGRGSRRAAKPSGGQGSRRAAKPLGRARLLPSRQTPGRRNEERGGGGNPFFRVVSVLRGPLFVNTCDYAIGSDLHNFELVRNFSISRAHVFP